MNARPDNLSEKEQQLTLELLQAIDSKDDISQRHLAQEMGVALGLANSYLKRCVKKGWIKMTTAPANRYLYYLTPMGFAEKARLTSEFLTTSLALFRQSGDEYDEVLSLCVENNDKNIVFAGLSDLTEIAYLRSLQKELSIIQVFQPETNKANFYELPVCHKLNEILPFDRIIMTSMEQTNELLDLLWQQFCKEKILVPSLLRTMQYRNDDEQHAIDLNNGHVGKQDKIISA